MNKTEQEKRRVDDYHLDRWHKIPDTDQQKTQHWVLKSKSKQKNKRGWQENLGRNAGQKKEQVWWEMKVCIEVCGGSKSKFLKRFSILERTSFGSMS